MTGTGSTAELMVRALEAEGVSYVFGVPGEENLDLLEALRTSSINFIPTRHEQGAGFMAATYGRLTGRAGVCLSTLGPGATNLVTPAAYAQLGGMPMVLITGQKPIKSSKQAQFQIVDVVDMLGPLTKSTHQLHGGANVPVRVREAFRLAEEERPGAVHLELPEDVAREPADAPILPRSMVRRPICEEKAVRRAVELIESACRPLLLVGAAANRKRTCKMLERLVERTGIPVVSTQMGKGVLDERSPHYLGNASLSEGDFVHRALDAADLVINVGHDVVEKPPFIMRPGGRTVIHVNFFSAAVDAVYFPQAELVGDIANTLWQLSERVTPPSHWDFTFTRTVREALTAHVEETASADGFPLRPARVVRDVREAVPEDGIVALDNGLYKIWFARNFPAYAPNTLLLDNALASMGAGLPSGLAAALLHPDRRVVCVCGDGGFMMNSQELETAVRLGVHLTVLILRDDAYGMIKWKQRMEGMEDFGLDFGNPDFVAYARSYGAQAHRVGAADELASVLAACLDAEGVHVIDCPVDYGDDPRLLGPDLQGRAAALSLDAPPDATDSEDA